MACSIKESYYYASLTENAINFEKFRGSGVWIVIEAGLVTNSDIITIMSIKMAAGKNYYLIEFNSQMY